MQLPTEASLLRIFIGESDRAHGRPLHEVLVELARKQGLAGATVLRGIMGFGASSRMHSSKVLRLSEDLPLVVEIVDSEEKISAFLPILEDCIGDGLVTLERAQVLRYRGSDPGSAST